MATLCEQESRVIELAALRARELELVHDPDRKLELRLDLSRLAGLVERRGGRVESLQRNLEERPGHEASVSALTEVLRDKGRHDLLCDILTQQAQAVASGGDAAR